MLCREKVLLLCLIMNDYKPIFDRARAASRELPALTIEQVDKALMFVADSIEENIPALLKANEKDLERMDPLDSKYDRLQLTEQRLRDIAADMRSVASLPSPLGQTLREIKRPNGMKIRKVTVPFGVIGVIYEARPNVTFDVFSLCFKAGSAVLLKGGSDARDTNACAAHLLRSCMKKLGVNPDAVQLLPVEHDSTQAMLEAVDDVDLIIPRGSKGLIDFVRKNSLVPVIETGAGVCHTYLHQSGLKDIARDLVFNAKTRRPSVCNTLDTLVIDRVRLADLPEICEPLKEKGVVIFADALSYAALEGKYPFLERAGDEDFGREWLSLKMSIKTVDSLKDAIEFITAKGSRHSECIVAEDEGAAERFTRDIDAACVYVNVSTAFTDGGQFGFGAEIGISTQKLHARGPMALPEITTYKYIITGNGQTRK